MSFSLTPLESFSLTPREQEMFGPLPVRRTAPAGMGTQKRVTKQTAGAASQYLHTITPVKVPKLEKEDIQGMATNLTTLRQIRGEDENFNTVWKALDGIYSGHGRNSQSTLTDRNSVYLQSSNRLTVLMDSITASTPGIWGIYPSENFKYAQINPEFGAKLVVDGEGKFLIPGSQDQLQAVEQRDPVGRMTFMNPFTKKHGVVVGSPTYWKVYKQYVVTSNADMARQWLGLLLLGGMPSGNLASAGLTTTRNVNQLDFEGSLRIPFETEKKNGFSPIQKKALQAGYEAIKDKEKKRLGSLSIIAQLLTNAHLLENDKSEALPPSKWVTPEGRAHAMKMTKEVLEGINRYLDRNSEAFAATGEVYYHPTDTKSAVRYSKHANKGEREVYTTKGVTKIPNATRRSMYNPLSVAYTIKGGDVKEIMVGPKDAAYLNQQRYANRNNGAKGGRPRTVAAAFRSGPGITTDGYLYASGKTTHHYPARGPANMGPYSNEDSLKRGKAGRGKEAGEYTNLSYHVGRTPHSSIVNYIEKEEPGQARKQRSATEQIPKDHTVPATRGKSTVGIPRTVQEELKKRGFTADRQGYYQMAAGYDRTTGEYKAIPYYNKTFKAYAEKEIQQRAKRGERIDPPSKDEWAALAAQGKGNHPYAQQKKASQRDAYNWDVQFGSF